MRRPLLIALAAALLLAGAAEAQTDFAIRPGERIGPYRLNMTVGDLQRALGTYKEEITDAAPFQVHRVLKADAVGVDAHVSIFGTTVLGLSVWKPTYRMPNGIGPNSSEGVLPRLFPDLPATIGGSAGMYYIDDKRGVAVVTDLGTITEVFVFPPGRARLLFQQP